MVSVRKVVQFVFAVVALPFVLIAGLVAFALWLWPITWVGVTSGERWAWLCVRCAADR